MIQAFVGQNIVDGSCGAGSRIGGSKDHSRDAGVNDRSRAHDTRFQGAIERGPWEPIVLARAGGFSQSGDFGVPRGIMLRDRAIPSAAKDLSIGRNDDGADRNLTGRQRFSGFFQSQFHKLIVHNRMVDYRAMHPVRSLVLALLLFSAAKAQGVRMPPEFLPLEVGKRWTYDLLSEAGQKTGQMAFVVEEYTIVAGTSFYVLSGFPFSNESEEIRFVRYDRGERQFMRKLGTDEGPLFFGDGSVTEVLESDSTGAALKFLLRMDTMTLTFERGVGIVEARLQKPAGVLIAKMVRSAPPATTAAPAPAPATTRTPATGNAGPGPAPTVVVPRSAPMVVIPPAAPPAGRRESVTATLSSENPQMNLGVSPSLDGYDIVIVVINTSEKLLPFRFNSSQTFDIVITNEAGKEVWRWSKERFFGQVVRSDSIRPKGRWQFQEAWNRRDYDGNLLEPGRYRITATITSLPAVSAPPVFLDLR